MGLSKDDVDNTKETQRPEVNKRTQKRRLRRKKLHAAKEDIINTNTQINVNKNIANINLTVCTEPKSVSEIPVSQPNQCNKKVSDKIQKFSCPVLDKVKSTESSSLDSNQKDLKSSPVNQISNIESQNQNTKSENKETQPKSSDANDNNKCKCESNKKQKSKSKNLIFTENQKTQSDNSIQIENQKLISENPLLSRNQQTAKFENIILTENKETKFEKPLFQNLESSLEKPTLAKNQKEEKKPSLIENQKTRVEKPGLTNNYKTKSDISILSQNQVNNIGVLNDKKTHNSIAPLNQNTDTITDSTTVNKGKKSKLDPVVSIENYNPGTEYNISVIEQISKSSVQEMGKSQDSTDLQKQPESNSKDLKTDDTTVNDGAAKSREDVKAAREAKKLAKQKAKKKNDASGDSVTMDKDESKASKASETKVSVVEMAEIPNKSTATVQDTKSKTKESFVPAAEKVVVTELEKGNVKADIKSEADGIEGTTEKTEDVNGKSKAELRAERRAKQEAQRAAKQAAVQAKVPKPAPKAEVKEEAVKTKEEKPVKAKSVEKTKPKAQSIQRVGWFWNHLNTESDKASLKNIPINSNLHPAVIKLGVQLASHVVTGSNARCIALLDALKKMVRDYSLPARTEFARGLEAQLTASVDFLASMRTPTASETNALKHFRRQLTQLPNNVDEFDAKKKLQEEIDRYIREQIDMAGEAISIIMRKKICDGDNILTYGCSSLIERILCEAWAAGVRFRATVVGARVNSGAREMLRRLLAAGLPAAYVDISALGCVMSQVSKVVLGAGALLANGAVVGAAGGAALALVARARNVPVLVACETHKFSERLRTDAFLCDEIGDPDDLIDKTDENSPLKDWRSNPNLNLLNLTYDVTPPSLITAVVTELGILPCTSAPVVLRFKLSEYGI